MTPARKHPILIVDDETEILHSLRALLRHDFEVFTAESGPQALEVLARQPIHVIMTDQRMPGMTGAELLARVRQQCPDAVPILFTGYADLKAVVDAVNRGHVYHYLTKPWDADDLQALLQEAIHEYERRADRERLLQESRAYVDQCQSLLRAMNGETGEVKETIRVGDELRQRLDAALRP